MNSSSKKLTDKISLAKLFMLFVLIVDFLLFILSTQGYYLSFLKPTGAIIPVLLTLISFYVVARKLKIKTYWVVLVTVVSLPFLGLLWVINFIEDNSYATVESPTGKEALVIEHRDATLGETNHFYNFYRKTAFPGMMIKLNEETVRIMTRGTYADNLEVLGINNAVWIDGEYVAFSSPYAETKVAFKNNSKEKLTQKENKDDELFVPQETDVIQWGEKVQNTGVMDEFIEDSKNGIESEIRYVILKNENDPIAVYILKSRTDSESDQSWVEISRDWSFDLDGYDLIEPQQCSGVSKDTERGAYYLSECFHTWEIKLMPVNETSH